MTNWTAVKEVKEKSAAKGKALAVLEAIARHINRKTGDAYPGRERIADLADCHPDNVRKYRRELEKLGELETEIQGGPGTSKLDKPNLYRIPLLAESLNSPPEQKCISDCVDRDKRKEIHHPNRPNNTKFIYSGGEARVDEDSEVFVCSNSTVLDKLKEFSVYELFRGAAGEAQFANLDPSNPELGLLRRELVRRTGLIPPPGFDSRMTREEASAKLHEMFSRKGTHHAEQ
jgi:hypothetical protein